MTISLSKKAVIDMKCLDQLDHIHFPCFTSPKEIVQGYLKKRSDKSINEIINQRLSWNDYNAQCKIYTMIIAKRIFNI